jgi:hypothetical protein
LQLGRSAISKAQLVITAVVLEGRSKSEVARDYDACRQWVQQLCKRYEADGDVAYIPRSPRPHHSPQAVTIEVEDRIVRLRKTLTKNTAWTPAPTPSPPISPPTPASRMCLPSPRSGESKAPWLRHTPTAQTAPLHLETLLRRAAQSTLASRRHPLAPRPRRRRGNFAANRSQRRFEDVFREHSIIDMAATASGSKQQRIPRCINEIG